MDEVSFAHHFFDRAADDQAVGSLRAAAMETVEAETRSQLAAASKHLADAMKAVGLDRWKGFVSGAQTRAHDKATLAAIQKSRQPVIPVSATVGASGQSSVGGGTRLATGVENNPFMLPSEGGGEVLPHGGGTMPDIGPPSAGRDPVPPSAAEPLPPPAAPAKGSAAQPAATDEPAEVTKPPSPPEAPANDPSAASVLDKLYRYTLNPGHPSGGPKAKWFAQALGFTRANMGDLAKQIVFDPSKAVQTSATEWGTKYNQVIIVTGANGRSIPVMTGWIRNADGIVRLVTAVPGD